MDRVKPVAFLFALLSLAGCGLFEDDEKEPEPVRTEAVFFSSNRAGRPANGLWLGMDVWVMDPDGKNLRQLTSLPEGDYYPADVSPDGRRLLLYRYDSGSLASGVYLLDLTQREAAPVQVSVPGLITTATAFFPDGERIVYRRFVRDEAGNYEGFFTYNLRDGTVEPVTGPQEQAVWGGLSPDGSRLCYSHYPSDLRWFALHVTDLASDVRRALTPEEYGNDAQYCAFTPSGEEIVYAQQGDGLPFGLNLYRMNVATGERHPVVGWSKPGDLDLYAYPNVDSVGTKVYMRVNYLLNGNAPFDIAVVNLDGSGFRKLTNDRHRDDTPVVANAYVWEE